MTDTTRDETVNRSDAVHRAIETAQWNGHTDRWDVPAFLRVLAEAGWTVAPLEPSKAMIDAGADKLEECTDYGYDSPADGDYRSEYVIMQSDTPAQIYRAMIQRAGE